MSICEIQQTNRANNLSSFHIYERRHLYAKNEERTVCEYERELLLVIEQLLTYSTVIDIDVAYVIEGTLFKSLPSHNLRR